MLFGKLHSWEVGTWENALGKLPLGKKSCGKFSNITLTKLRLLSTNLFLSKMYIQKMKIWKIHDYPPKIKKAWGLVNYLPTDTYLTYPSDFDRVPFITLKGHSCTLKTGVLSEMNLNSLKSRCLGKIYIELKKGKIYWAKVVPSI